jgi:hypothetical protein
MQPITGPICNELFEGSKQSSKPKLVGPFSLKLGKNKPASFSFELYVQRETRPGDCELFEIGSARTRSDADAAHIRKVQGVVYVDTSDEANVDE